MNVERPVSSDALEKRVRPELVEGTTWGVKYGYAMEVTTREEAVSYFDACVVHQMQISGCSREVGAQIERRNIAYWTGFCSGDTAARVFDLFDLKKRREDGYRVN